MGRRLPEEVQTQITREIQRAHYIRRKLPEGAQLHNPPLNSPHNSVFSDSSRSRPSVPMFRLAPPPPPPRSPAESLLLSPSLHPSRQSPPLLQKAGRARESEAESQSERGSEEERDGESEKQEEDEEEAINKRVDAIMLTHDRSYIEALHTPLTPAYVHKNPAASAKKVLAMRKRELRKFLRDNPEPPKFAPSHEKWCHRPCWRRC